MRIHHMENVKKALDFMKYKKVCKYVRMYMYVYVFASYCNKRLAEVVHMI